MQACSHVVQREGSVLDSPHRTLTQDSVQIRCQKFHQEWIWCTKSQAYIPLTSTPRGSRDELFNTPGSTPEVLTPRGLPSTKVRHEEQTSAPEEEMVDVTVLVLGQTKCLTEREGNASERQWTSEHR